MQTDISSKDNQEEIQEKIKNAYDFVNGVLNNGTYFNDKETKRWVIEKLQVKMNHSVIVKCDEENNPPEVIDKCLLIADLLWNVDYTEGQKIAQCRLIFGEPNNVMEYQQQLSIDNDFYNFIQKGI